MPALHLLRVGAMAHLGWFRSVDAARYPRGARVIVRTARGMEQAEVLEHGDDVRATVEGDVLRGVTIEDELLDARLRKNRDAAYAACAARIAALSLPVVLMDVEHLFDGETLIFHFLGETSPALDQITAELAELYETKVQFRKFAEAVTTGCGPGCGTEHAEGPGCGSCGAGCAMAGACGA